MHHDLPSFPTRRSSDLAENKNSLNEQFRDIQATRRVSSAERCRARLTATLMGPPEVKMASLSPLQDLTRNADRARFTRDRKSTRLNSSHQISSYAVFCL